MPIFVRNTSYVIIKASVKNFGVTIKCWWYQKRLEDIFDKHASKSSTCYIVVAGAVVIVRVHDA